MKSLYRILLILVICGAIVGIVFICLPSKKATKINAGKINRIDTMVELCAIDFYNEVPIIDTVQNWVLFAKQKQRGSISFDLENLNVENGDTILITLPPEIIEIMEATDENSWESIDSKDLRKMRWEKASPEIWNEVKKNALKQTKRDLYESGIVERARIEGGENLKGFMEIIFRKPVKIIDPTPKGAHYEEYSGVSN